MSGTARRSGSASVRDQDVEGRIHKVLELWKNRASWGPVRHRSASS